MIVSLSAEVFVLRRFSGKFVLWSELVSNGATKVTAGMMCGADTKSEGDREESGVITHEDIMALVLGVLDNDRRGLWIVI